VYIHGGGWISGHSRQAGAFANFPEVLASLAGRGYVTASVNYRLCHEAGFPAAVMDIKTAIRWLRSKAGGFGLDPERAAVWGGSAGGQIAALVAVTGGLEAFDPARPAFDREGRPISGFLPAEVICQSDCVQAAAAWYGVFDFAAMFRQAGFMEGAPAPGAHGVFTYLGFDPSNRRPEILEAASCTTYIDRNTPPMLLIHGVEDTIVPYRQSEDMAAKLKKAGVPAELILIPGVGHSFLGGSPDQIHEASLTALHATIGFFDKTIGPCK